MHATGLVPDLKQIARMRERWPMLVAYPVRIYVEGRTCDARTIAQTGVGILVNTVYM